VDYDAELIRYRDILLEACAPGPGDRLLDIGSGTGQTSRDAAEAGARVLGVDISAEALARAARHPGVAYLCADAQTHPFEPGSFDAAVSRFGTMFFDDPVAAFTNIGRALRPAGRLVMLVWQAASRNEWHETLRRILDHPFTGPDPFSLADPQLVTTVLADAGFGEVTLEEVRVPVHYGPDVPAALSWIRGFAGVGEALDRRGPAATATLTEALAEHLTPDGVRFDSRSWLVRARRA
jgi:SAM-dependent methyltransferase